MPGHEEVGVRRRCAEVGRRPRDPQHALPKTAADLLTEEHPPLEGAEQREPLPVRRDPVDDLLDHVPRLAARRDGRRDRGEVRCDLEPADAVPVDERRAVAEGLGARVVEGVQQLAREAADLVRHARAPEATRGDDDGVERLAVDAPAFRDPLHRRPEPDPVGDAEVPRVVPEVIVDLRRGGMERVVGGSREVRERRHRPARVRVHAGPDAAVRRVRLPLPADVVARLEDRDVEARLERVLRGHQAARAGADNGHACIGSQPHSGDARRSGDIRIATPVGCCASAHPYS